MHAPFISTDDLAAFMGADSIDPDLRAVMALDSACQSIRTQTEQHINLVRGDTATLYGHRRHTLLLPQLPVVQVNSVTMDGEGVTDHRVAFGGILYREDGQLWTGEIVVDYDHGYAISEDDVDIDGDPHIERVPSDLRLIALRIAAGTYQSMTPAVTQGMRAESLGSYAYTRADSLLTNDDKRILDFYRIKKVPVP